MRLATDTEGSRSGAPRSDDRHTDDRRTDDQDRAGAPAGSFVPAVILTLAGVGLVLLTRVVLVPWIESANGWVIPQDVWTALPAARSVANGDVFNLYGPLVGRTGYPYTPGLPLLLAPFVAIGDHFHLTGDYFFQHRRPQMFLVLGPAEAVLGMLPILFVSGRALTTGVADAGTKRMWAVQGAVFVMAAWAPIAWFHPEDTIACALLIAACLRTEHDDWRIVGALVGGALLFKQWALWPAIPILLAAPRDKRALCSFYALALPALVLVPFVIAGTGTWSSLVGTRASLVFGQQQLWATAAFGHRQLANATLLRLAWGAAAVWVARRTGRRPSIDTLLAAVGAVMLLRLVFEPVLFGYYLVPATVVAVIWCARNGRPIVLRAVTASMLCAFCLPHTFPEPVFFGVLAAGLAYVCGPMLEPLLGRTVPRRRVAAVAGSASGD